MSELEKIAKEICNLKYVGASCYDADGKLPDFYELIGMAFLDIHKTLKDLKRENQTSSDKASHNNLNEGKALKSQTSELEKTAKEICNLKYIGACCYNAKGKLPDFYELIGKAFLAIDESLKNLEKNNNTNVKCHCHHNSKAIEEAQEKTR